MKVRITVTKDGRYLIGISKNRTLDITTNVKAEIDRTRAKAIIDCSNIVDSVEPVSKLSFKQYFIMIFAPPKFVKNISESVLESIKLKIRKLK